MTYKYGDVVRDAAGLVWERDQNGWWLPGDNRLFGDDAPLRPLVKLGPEATSNPE